MCCLFRGSCGEVKPLLSPCVLFEVAGTACESQLDAPHSASRCVHRQLSGSHIALPIYTRPLWQQRSRSSLDHMLLRIHHIFTHTHFPFQCVLVYPRSTHVHLCLRSSQLITHSFAHSYLTKYSISGKLLDCHFTPS